MALWSLSMNVTLFLIAHSVKQLTHVWTAGRSSFERDSYQTSRHCLVYLLSQNHEQELRIWPLHPSGPLTWHESPPQPECGQLGQLGMCSPNQPIRSGLKQYPDSTTLSAHPHSKLYCEWLQYSGCSEIHSSLIVDWTTKGCVFSDMPKKEFGNYRASNDTPFTHLLFHQFKKITTMWESCEWESCNVYLNCHSTPKLRLTLRWRHFELHPTISPLSQNKFP